MKSKGKQLTSLVTKYNFSREEMQVLEPLYKKRNEYDKQIQEFVGKAVMPRLNLQSNIKYATRFNIPHGWIKVKDMTTRMDLYPSIASTKDVVGWGEK